MVINPNLHELEMLPSSQSWFVKPEVTSLMHPEKPKEHTTNRGHCTVDRILGLILMLLAGPTLATRPGWAKISQYLGSLQGP